MKQAIIAEKNLQSSIEPGKMYTSIHKINSDICEKLNQRFIAIDVETTGLSVENGDKIVEIGIVLFENRVPTKSFATLVNPMMKMPAEAKEINHISNSSLKAAPMEHIAFANAMGFLKNCDFSNTYLVAYNAKFDAKFLKASFERMGYSETFDFVDAYGLALECISSSKNYKLPTIAKRLKIDTGTSHRAKDDATACGYILASLLDKKKKLLEKEQKAIEKENQKINKYSLNQEELEVCAFIQHELRNKNVNVTPLGFISKNQTTVDAYYSKVMVFSLKFNKGTKFVIINRNYLSSKDIAFVEALSSEDPINNIRIPFKTSEELQKIIDSIALAIEKSKDFNGIYNIHSIEDYITVISLESEKSLANKLQ